MKRKVIALADARIAGVLRTVAICDDGTLWYLDDDALAWQPIVSVPQS